MDNRNERAARLAMLENAIRFAAANPGTDLSQEEEDDEVFDPFRNVEPPDEEMEKQSRRLAANPSY